jgi:DNA repair exonuclease SbcCD nuclease subunit
MSELKVLTIGDIHAKSSNTQEIKLLTEKLRKIALECKPDAIFLMGDLANDHAKMHILAWMAICDLIFTLKKICPVYYIVGNHDYLNNSCFLTDEHFFNVFKRLDYNDIDEYPVYVIDKPQFLNFEQHKTKLVACPYVYPGRLLEALEPLGSLEGVSTVFCHQELKDCKMGAIVSTQGDVWPEDYPPLVSGHIHDRQTVGKNGLFIGTPRYTAHGETGKKTVSLFIFSEGKRKEILIDTQMPKKTTKIVSVEELETLEIDEGEQARIIVTGTSEEIAKVKKTKKFKELDKKAKVITKPSDKVLIAKAGDQDYNYLSILQHSIDSESERVKKVFEEINRDVATKA